MIFYESFWEAASCLPPEEKTAAVMAIVEYGCTGKIPEMSGAAQAVFLVAKPLLDANAAKKAAGSKGGRPKKDAEPTARNSNKFVNFKHSGRDWDAEAEKIMEHDSRASSQ